MRKQIKGQMYTKAIKINEEWYEMLKNEFEKPYFGELKHFLEAEKKQHCVFPPGSLVFESLNCTPISKLKVVLLGQDPYHGNGQAHGLCFSVQKGTPIPPSLKNIFKEIKSDLNIEQPLHGDLSQWASEGVFLLNTTLTVREGNAGSHQGKGWEIFTDEIIRILSIKKQNLVFILWGKHAQSKLNLIDLSKHFVLQAPHPSPFSAYNGFFGCSHFSKCNHYLEAHDIKPINWQRT